MPGPSDLKSARYGLLDCRKANSSAFKMLLIQLFFFVRRMASNLEAELSEIKQRCWDCFGQVRMTVLSQMKSLETKVNEMYSEVASLRSLHAKLRDKMLQSQNLELRLRQRSVPRAEWTRLCDEVASKENSFQELSRRHRDKELEVLKMQADVQVDEVDFDY